MLIFFPNLADLVLILTPLEKKNLIRCVDFFKVHCNNEVGIMREQEIIIRKLTTGIISQETSWKIMDLFQNHFNTPWSLYFCHQISQKLAKIVFFFILLIILLKNWKENSGKRNGI